MSNQLTLKQPIFSENDPEIKAMTNLVNAYMNNEIHEFERVLRENRSSLMRDPFIAQYIEDLLLTVRSQVLIKILVPYTNVKLSFLAGELNVGD